MLSLCLTRCFNQIYTLGRRFKKATVVHPSIQKFEDLNLLFQAFKESSKKPDRILIKGSRSLELERIIPSLETL